MKIILVGEPMALFMAEETGPLHKARRFTSAIAGAEYNVAVGLARLGHQPLFCTRLGDDPFGDKIAAGLAKNGISTALVRRGKGERTGFMLKSFVTQGDPEIAYYREGSAASRITPEDVDQLNLSGVGWLHMTGIFPAISPSALAAARRLLQRAKEAGMAVSFDPNLRPQLWESRESMVQTLNELAAGADLVLPGQREGLLLTGREDPAEIAAFYHGLGVRRVIVKTGALGAYYSQAGGEAGTSPGFPVREVVDTVGAGDGFAAGAVSALAEGLGLAQAAARGNVIGALQVSRQGDNDGLPTREELERTILAGTA